MENVYCLAWILLQCVWINNDLLEIILTYEFQSEAEKISRIRKMWEFDDELRQDPSRQRVVSLNIRGALYEQVFRNTTFIEINLINVNIIDEGAFKFCHNLVSICLSESVKEIPKYAFYGCRSLKIVTIPSSVTKIGESAFAFYRMLHTAHIPPNVEIIEDGAFAYCNSLIRLNIPNSVTRIGPYAFHDCYSLKMFKFGEGVTNFEEGTFCGCTKLKFVEIGRNVNNIDLYAFQSCVRLHAIIDPRGKNIVSDAFYSYHFVDLLYDNDCYNYTRLK